MPRNYSSILTLSPIIMEVKNGCISNRMVTFQIVCHFPLNHDYGRRSSASQRFSCTWNPNDPCFSWSLGLLLEGSTWFNPRNKGHSQVPGMQMFVRSNPGGFSAVKSSHPMSWESKGPTPSENILPEANFLHLKNGWLEYVSLHPKILSWKVKGYNLH